MDSIPMLIFSGQARYATTVYVSGLKLRTRGVQEFDIIGLVSNMTKYCELVSDPLKIAFYLEKALYIAKTERPGPCWLDIPLDVQGAIIETDELIHYVPQEKEKKIDKSVVSDIIYKLEKSERPVVFVGNGVRLAGAHDKFLKLIEK